MLDKQYIVTEIFYTGKESTSFAAKQIDNNDFCDVYEPETGISYERLEIGDVVGLAKDGSFKKKLFTGTEYETATVMNVVQVNEPGTIGKMLNVVMAFSAKYGDIQIKLDSPYAGNGRINAFLNSQRDDRIVVRKKHDGKYEIIANLTANEIRKNALTRTK
jgi:hypothetical protein